MKTRSADGIGTKLRRLIELMDGDVEAMYREDDPVYSPRFTPIMKALADGSALSIKDIAAQSSVSHSAASQSISIMVAEGLVELRTNVDRRSRLVTLSKRGNAILPWLEARWTAVIRAADALDRELDYPLSEVLSQAIAALESKPFATRIRAEEAADSGFKE